MYSPSFTTATPTIGMWTYTLPIKWEFCAKCGAKLDAAWHYCGQCGTQIGTLDGREIQQITLTYPTHPYPVDPYPSWGPWKITCGTAQTEAPCESYC